MNWHHQPDVGIHTRHPQPDLPVPFTVNKALNLNPGQERAATAAHEAGHAALYLAHDIPFVDIHIGSTGPDQNGITPAAQVRMPSRFTATLGHLVQALAAGERAQDRWLHEQGLWTPDRAWAVEVTARSDRHEIGRHDPGRDMGDLTALHHEVDRALDQLWPSVLRLAEALDQYGHLTFEQASRYAALPVGR